MQEPRSERVDTLRKRPDVVRYSYLAVGEDNIHIGLSHAGLSRAAQKDNITKIFVSDLVTKRVQIVGLTTWLKWWAQNYQDPTAEYKEEDR